MIKRIRFLLLVLIVAKGNLLSQHLSHQVLVPAAGIAVTGSISYSQTIGETAIEIIGCPDYVFTQGFQQPAVKLSPGIQPDGNGVQVYPNPAIDYINIKYFGDVARKFTIEIINIAGTIVKTDEIRFVEKYYFIQQITISDLPKGLYFVRVYSNDGLIIRAFKIEKM